jgi:hypothetical protein
MTAFLLSIDLEVIHVMAIALEVIYVMAIALEVIHIINIVVENHKSTIILDDLGKAMRLLFTT